MHEIRIIPTSQTVVRYNENMPNLLVSFLHPSFISLDPPKVYKPEKISVGFIKKKYKYSSDNKVLSQSGRSKANAIKVDGLRVEFQIASAYIKFILGFYRDQYLQRLPKTL